MSETIIAILLKALEAALTAAAEKGVEYIIRKIVDGTGKVVSEIFYRFDSDGDGELDSEQIIYTLDITLTDLGDGYCLCNRDNEIGIGYPKLKLVDASDVLPILRDDYYISDGNGFSIDYDNDGDNDTLFPLPFDGTGDGLPDFQVICDDDDNGLPDVAPDSPFYPIGSEGYQEIVEAHSENVPALDKSFKNYTVTEALLFLIFIGSAVAMISKIFKRRKL